MAKETHMGTKARTGLLYLVLFLACILLGFYLDTKSRGKHDHAQIRQRVFGMDKKGTQGAYIALGSGFEDLVFTAFHVMFGFPCGTEGVHTTNEPNSG